MIKFEDAKQLVLEADAYFPELRVDRIRLKLWADTLCEPAALEPEDARTALKRMATATHDEFYRFSLAEWIQLARGESRRRVAAAKQDLGRTALPAKTATPVDPVRAKIVRDVWLAVAMRQLPEAEAQQEIDRRMREATAKGAA
jgi:hypothetical protein